MTLQDEAAVSPRRISTLADLMHYKSSNLTAREYLSKLRAEIDQFPARKQAVLLHEFEETETRISAIAKARAEAWRALANSSARPATSPSTTADGTVQKMIHSLVFQRRMLEKLLDDNERRLNR